MWWIYWLLNQSHFIGRKSQGHTQLQRRMRECHSTKLQKAARKIWCTGLMMTTAAKIKDGPEEVPRTVLEVSSKGDQLPWSLFTEWTHTRNSSLICVSLYSSDTVLHNIFLQTVYGVLDSSTVTFLSCFPEITSRDYLGWSCGVFKRTLWPYMIVSCMAFSWNRLNIAIVSGFYWLKFQRATLSLSS